MDMNSKRNETLSLQKLIHRFMNIAQYSGIDVFGEQRGQLNKLITKKIAICLNQVNITTSVLHWQIKVTGKQNQNKVFNSSWCSHG
jgi:hypothetical protein